MSSPPGASLLDELAGQEVHLVGISSLEIADVACFLGLGASGRPAPGAMIGHDLAEPGALEEHFRAAHIGMSPEERAEHWSRLAELDMPLRLGDAYLDGIDRADVVVVSQAWRLYERNAPLRSLVEAGRARLVTPIEVYVALAEQRGIGTVGVTGSNGKSTTTNLIAHLLADAGLPVVLAGNYRYRGPILESLVVLPSAGRLVLEISNHHLLALREPVDVAVVTNVTPNHIEEHGSFEAYVAVKRRLVECQRPGGVAILNDDDPVSRRFEAAAVGQVRRFGLASGQLGERLDAGVDSEGGDDWLAIREGAGIHPLLPAAGFPLPGRHNLHNALAAALAAVAAGVPAEGLGEALRTVESPPGRLEVVRDSGGVRIVYDIESTTPDSTRRGLEAFRPGCVHLVAGGDDKGLDYDAFVAAVAERRARLYLLDGTASESIRAEAEARGVGFTDCRSLDEAVQAAWTRAASGDVILLSPGARGFYNQHIRGRVSFARVAKRLRRAELGSERDAGGEP